MPSYPVVRSRIPPRLLPTARHITYGLTRIAVDQLAFVTRRGRVISVVTLRDFSEFFDLSSREFRALLATSTLIALRGWGFRDNGSFRSTPIS